MAVSRRAIPESEYAAAFPSLAEGCDISKIKIAVVDFEKMVEEEGSYADIFAGTHFVASALGTSPWTQRVDVDYSAAGAKLAAAAGTVTQFSLVTSAGASPTSWIGYLKAKGRQEQDCKALAFPRLTVLRPGALDRGA